MTKLAILNPIKNLKSQIIVFKIIFNNYLTFLCHSNKYSNNDMTVSDGYLI